MSTRSTTWFTQSGGSFAPVEGQPLEAYEVDARVYRHSDGYPEGHGTDLHRFFSEAEDQTQDTRFGDPCYLAAKLVVYLAAEFALYSAPYDLGVDGELPADRDARRAEWACAHPLAFLSVGVCQRDPGDIEYVYVVDCGTTGQDEQGHRVGARPRVTCYEVAHPNDWDGPLTLGAEQAIPLPGKRFEVYDLQACALEELPTVAGISVDVIEEADSMGFPRVSVSAPTREALLDYIRANWGGDEETGGWYSEYVVASVAEVAS